MTPSSASIRFEGRTASGYKPCSDNYDMSAGRIDLSVEDPRGSHAKFVHPDLPRRPTPSSSWRTCALPLSGGPPGLWEGMAQHMTRTVRRDVATSLDPDEFDGPVDKD
ncbi:hypothetical protein [Streptosporangium sp. NPDC006007]|uniref:hypothetical protein n=1 Tax=Streptosporangium sp. NPDC006007 TaxID=3154575 RepID=UPI0033B06D7A